MKKTKNTNLKKNNITKCNNSDLSLSPNEIEEEFFSANTEYSKNSYNGSYLDVIPKLQKDDYDLLVRKDKEYGGAWIKSYDLGIVQGVSQLLFEKWERIMNQLKKSNFDILKCIQNDKRDEGVLDDFRDFRRYLYLIEAELYKRGILQEDIEEQLNTEYLNDR